MYKRQGPIVVQTTMQIGNAILNISSLSFVGLGIQPPAPEWGSLLSDVREYMRYDPYLVIAPGIAIVLTVFAFNRVGDGLRDALDLSLIHIFFECPNIRNIWFKIVNY